jgi:hypothetical protein
MKLRLAALIALSILAIAPSVGTAAPPRGGGPGGNNGSGCIDACNILDTVCRVVHTKETCDQRLKDCKADCKPPSILIQ